MLLIEVNDWTIQVLDMEKLIFIVQISIENDFRVVLFFSLLNILLNEI